MAWEENLNSDDQQYATNIKKNKKNTTTAHLNLLNIKMITTFDNENPDPVPKQAQNMAGLHRCYIKYFIKVKVLQWLPKGSFGRNYNDIITPMSPKLVEHENDQSIWRW